LPSYRPFYSMRLSKLSYGRGNRLVHFIISTSKGWLEDSNKHTV
jgi:hypothetical protein